MIEKQTLISSLDKIYQQSKINDDYESLNILLESIKINNLVQYYIHHHNERYDDDDIVVMEFIIQILQNIYNNSGIECPISDDDYDTLYETFLNASDTNIVGSDVINNDREMTQHTYPDLRGTLDKVHFIRESDRGNDKRKSIEGWLKTCENRLGRPLKEDECEVTLYPKFDGVSVVFENDINGNTKRALTRGDTKANEATILKMFKLIKFKPIHDWTTEFGVKTEVICTYKNFEKLCNKYGKFKSPRSAASSIINTKEASIDMLRYISIIPLRYQNFDTKEIIIPPQASEYPSIKTNIKNWDKLKESFTVIKEYMKNIVGIPIDGVVIRFNNPDIQSLLGRDDAINKYEVAFKFAPEGVRTKILDVEFCIGVLGGITPVASIEPVVMEGNTISNVSLNSIDRFESLKLHKGDEVLIKYDIIPYLYTDNTCKQSNGEPIVTPTHCEYCHEKLIYDPVLRCVNNDCPSRQIGKMVNYIEKLNIENISIGIVTYLFKEGYLKSIEDLYNIENIKNKLAQLKGLGPKMVERITKGIDKRMTVYDYELLGAIGIPDVGLKTFKKISNIYYIDDILEIALKHDRKKLTDIPGIKDKTADKIIVGLISNMKLISFLKGVLYIKHDGREYKMKVVFTKMKRDKKFEAYLDSIDIEVCESYTKQVDMVICEDSNISSSKITKAKKDGKKILSIEEAYHFFKYKN